MITELIPVHDARKSFYHKAIVVQQHGRPDKLYSYGQLVATIDYTDSAVVTLMPIWDYSQTTVRHVKEFLKQNHFKADNTAQMRRDYA